MGTHPKSHPKFFHDTDWSNPHVFVRLVFADVGLRCSPRTFLAHVSPRWSWEDQEKGFMAPLPNSSHFVSVKVLRSKIALETKQETSQLSYSVQRIKLLVALQKLLETSFEPGWSRYINILFGLNIYFGGADCP